MTPHFNCPSCGHSLSVQSTHHPQNTQAGGIFSRSKGMFASGTGDVPAFSVFDYLDAFTSRKTIAVRAMGWDDVAIPAVSGSLVAGLGTIATYGLFHFVVITHSQAVYGLAGSLIAGGLVLVKLFGVAQSTLHSIEENPTAKPRDIQEFVTMPAQTTPPPPAQTHRVEIETKHGASVSRSWLELPAGVTPDIMRRIAELSRGNVFTFSRPFLCDTMKVLSQGKYNKLKRTLENAGMVQSLAGNRTELTGAGRALLRSYLPATAH